MELDLLIEGEDMLGFQFYRPRVRSSLWFNQLWTWYASSDETCEWTPGYKHRDMFRGIPSSPAGRLAGINVFCIDR